MNIYSCVENSLEFDKTMNFLRGNNSEQKESFPCLFLQARSPKVR